VGYWVFSEFLEDCDLCERFAYCNMEINHPGLCDQWWIYNGLYWTQDIDVTVHSTSMDECPEQYLQFLELDQVTFEPTGVCLEAVRLQEPWPLTTHECKEWKSQQLFYRDEATGRMRSVYNDMCLAWYSAGVKNWVLEPCRYGATDQQYHEFVDGLICNVATSKCFRLFKDELAADCLFFEHWVGAGEWMTITGEMIHDNDGMEFSNIVGPPGDVRWRDSGRDIMIFRPPGTDGDSSFDISVMRAHLDSSFYFDAIRGSWNSTDLGTSSRPDDMESPQPGEIWGTQPELRHSGWILFGVNTTLIKQGGEWGPEVEGKHKFEIPEMHFDYPANWVRWEVAQSSADDDVFIDDIKIELRCVGERLPVPSPEPTELPTWQPSVPPTLMPSPGPTILTSLAPTYFQQCNHTRPCTGEDQYCTNTYKCGTATECCVNDNPIENTTCPTPCTNVQSGQCETTIGPRPSYIFSLEYYTYFDCFALRGSDVCPNWEVCLAMEYDEVHQVCRAYISWPQAVPVGWAYYHQNSGFTASHILRGPEEPGISCLLWSDVNLIINNVSIDIGTPDPNEVFTTPLPVVVDESRAPFLYMLPAITILSFLHF